MKESFYTIFYATTLGIVCALLLAGTNRYTQERFLAIMEAITGERLPMEDMGEMTAAPGQLVPYVEMLGKLGDSDRAQIKCYSQLTVERRNAHGRLNLT